MLRALLKTTLLKVAPPDFGMCIIMSLPSNTVSRFVSSPAPSHPKRLPSRRPWSRKCAIAWGALRLLTPTPPTSVLSGFRLLL